MPANNVPIINVQNLVRGACDISEVAHHIKMACTKNGFFYIENHGISETLQMELEKLTKQFFSMPYESKMKISMSKGGRAWRGYFPLGDEMTSGKPDLKEGLYFGKELDENHPKVLTRTPLHGSNLFSTQIPRLKEVVLEYMDQLSVLGHSLMKGIGISLGLSETFFNENYTQDALTLFRIFHYPSTKIPFSKDAKWGVGEHTDYGLLTILKQDQIGGLQIKSKSGWIDAPYIQGTLICNIGDMLHKMTYGYYQSTPHRVINKSGKSRYSWPFFFDPNWDVSIGPLPIQAINGETRKYEFWDGTDLEKFQGTYGDYILRKVGKVFPNLQT